MSKRLHASVGEEQAFMDGLVEPIEMDAWAFVDSRNNFRIMSWHATAEQAWSSRGYINGAAIEQAQKCKTPYRVIRVRVSEIFYRIH